ncbi:MAG: hypothetical protein SCARUB_01672 [Candidatus Scalindua rubra]|uniref:Uncharacterized protein n=1 Tax=Candidatus Scalindua rubra TaxID=1872076 RepID=A0A1E3XE13_9BACT|nr:MAG: hypothetical protein SCARUB_01672 [Candidatus Scalindua rubra]
MKDLTLAIGNKNEGLAGAVERNTIQLEKVTSAMTGGLSSVLFGYKNLFGSHNPGMKNHNS